MINHSHELLIRTLKVRWQKLLESYHIDQQMGAPIFQEILSAYSEPHRHYHNLNHLNHMFHELDSCKTDSCNAVTNEMLWAVWYHDFIYKPGAKTNEAKSAKKAKESMGKLDIQQSSIDKVVSHILVTENHQCETNDSDTQFFLDADMAILGSDEISYAKYRKAVRQEHSNIPDFLFNRGRKKFLSTVLEQKFIFASSYFKNRYEQIARENIKSELLALKTG